MNVADLTNEILEQYYSAQRDFHPLPETLKIGFDVEMAIMHYSHMNRCHHALLDVPNQRFMNMKLVIDGTLQFNEWQLIDQEKKTISKGVIEK